MAHAGFGDENDVLFRRVIKTVSVTVFASEVALRELALLQRARFREVRAREILATIEHTNCDSTAVPSQSLLVCQIFVRA